MLTRFFATLRMTGGRAQNDRWRVQNNRLGGRMTYGVRREGGFQTRPYGRGCNVGVNSALTVYSHGNGESILVEVGGGFQLGW